VPTLLRQQSDKGGLVFGGAIDLQPYGQRGTLPMAEEVAAAADDILAAGACALKVLRQGAASWT